MLHHMLARRTPGSGPRRPRAGPRRRSAASGGHQSGDLFVVLFFFVMNDLGCITGGIDILLMNRARQGFFETFVGLSRHARG